MESLQINSILLILINCVYVTLSTQNCSALRSYVQVYTTSNPDTGETITSSQALFAPHSYYIPETELVQLSASDDPCDEDSIDTVLTNKIVLLFSDTSSCSDHLQVYVAEQNGAKAVLMTSDDLTVVNIIDDNSIYDSTTIPMRGITLDKGTEISNALTAGDTVTIEFGCDVDDEYPTVICVLDEKGYHWWLDGDYVLQE
eukprot:307688_1